MLVFLDEILPQAHRRHVGDDGFRIQPGAANGNRALIDVGGKHLQLQRVGFELLVFRAQDRQAVGLFAGRAASGPDAHLFTVVILVPGAEQRTQHMAFEGFEGLAVAEEVGNSDQHVAKQLLGFIRGFFQLTQVAG